MIPLLPTFKKASALCLLLRVLLVALPSRLGCRHGSTSLGCRLGSSSRGSRFGSSSRGFRLGSSSRGWRFGSSSRGLRLGSSSRGCRSSRVAGCAARCRLVNDRRLALIQGSSGGCSVTGCSLPKLVFSGADMLVMRHIKQQEYSADRQDADIDHR